MATIRSGYDVRTIRPDGLIKEYHFSTFREALYHYNDYKWLKLHYHTFKQVILYGVRYLKDGNIERDVMRSYPKQ